MKNNYTKFFLFIGILPLFIISSFAQTPTAQPTPPNEEPIKIYTEEVHLNVTAQTSGGKFVSTLKPDDLLIVESGTPQKIESMKKIPANVLLLLDTGGNLNFAKTLGRTRLTAKLLVQKLSPDDSIAVMQSYDKIEIVSDWTSNQETIQDNLDKKLFSGNRSRFAASIAAAIEMFKTRSVENRHLIFIGDGLDSIATENDRRKALQDLLAANITVHVIAYNRMEAKQAKPMTRRIQIGEEKETPRLPDYILESIVQGMPKEMRDGFRRFALAERLFIVRLDNKALKLAKQKLDEWIKSETELQSLSADTGGMFQAPEAIDTMWLFATEIAAAIDSQYVVTYIPTKSFADAESNEARKIRVSTHCSGVTVRSRQKVVSYKPNSK